MPKPNTQSVAAPAEKTFLEGYELWKAGCDIWLAYLAQLPNIRTPAALMEANTRLMARSLDICGMATGEMLVDAGVREPTLSDS